MNSWPSCPWFILLIMDVLLLDVVLLNSFIPIATSFLLHPNAHIITNSGRRTKSFCSGTSNDRASCLNVTSSSSNHVSSSIIIEDDNLDEEDLYLRSLYPSKSSLFDETNVIVKSFPLLSKSNSDNDNDNKSDNLFLNQILPICLVSISEQKGKKNSSNLFSKLLTSFGESNTRISSSNSNISNKHRIGVDASIEYDDAYIGAKEIVMECLKQSSWRNKYHCEENCDCNDTAYNFDEKKEDSLEEDTLNMIDNLTSIFSYYQNIFNDNNNQNKNGKVRCKARVVSSYGKSGCKCPRWHIDHVPLRLVMSLKGPGCVYVPHEREVEMATKKSMSGAIGDDDYLVAEMPRLNRAALNGIDIDDSKIANEIIMPNKSEDVLALIAKEMEAVLLMGRCWEERQQTQSPAAVPHRSPDLEVDQMRILLTIDVVPMSKE